MCERHNQQQQQQKKVLFVKCVSGGSTGYASGKVLKYSPPSLAQQDLALCNRSSPIAALGGQEQGVLWEAGSEFWANQDWKSRQSGVSPPIWAPGTGSDYFTRVRIIEMRSPRFLLPLLSGSSLLGVSSHVDSVIPPAAFLGFTHKITNSGSCTGVQCEIKSILTGADEPRLAGNLLSCNIFGCVIFKLTQQPPY